MLKTSLCLTACLVLTLGLGHCSSDDKNGATTTPGNDAGGGQDAGTSKDGSSKSDADAEPLGCVPSDVSSFSPSWKPPAAFNQGRCTPAQVDLLVDCMFGNRPATCDDAEKASANLDCLGCLFTDVTSGTWGPIVMEGDLGNVNEGGCIANFTGDKAASSCGAKFSALAQCESVGCDEVCSDDEASYTSCIEAVESGGCASLLDAAACADDLVASGGVAEKCEEGSDFVAWATAVGKLFCAGGASDGGADAADGGG